MFHPNETHLLRTQFHQDLSQPVPVLLASPHIRSAGCSWALGVWQSGEGQEWGLSNPAL